MVSVMQIMIYKVALPQFKGVEILQIALMSVQSNRIAGMMIRILAAIAIVAASGFSLGGTKWLLPLGNE
jgi:hypothetical protein